MPDLDESRDAPEVDEGSWIYLSAGPPTDGDESRELRRQLTEACAKNGWRTVSHPSAEQMRRAADPGRFYSGLSYAVEHADVVVALLGERSEIADAELTLAYTHRRPVVGVQVDGASLDSEARMLLHDYERGRVVTCSTPGECVTALRRTLSDPDFAETIRQSG
jgi:hypothetical protein